MAGPIYTRFRGETLEFGVADTGATFAGQSLVASALRPLAAGRSAPDPASVDAATLTVTYRPADSDNAVGWLLSLDAVTCAALAAGTYIVDLKITDSSGNISITSPAIVILAEPATL